MTTITIERALLEQALEALELVTEDYDDSAVGLEIEAIQALRAALAAPATAPDELERLKAESEERLQNCAALVAENEQLRKDAERYQWLKSAKGLTLESERGAPWTMENGSTFSPSHRLCAGGTQFAPHETLDDAIDAAMKGTP